MADAAIHGHDHDQTGFFTRWFMSPNHKDIGILYLFTGGLVGLIPVIFTVYMRLELMNPGVQYMCAEGMRLVADAARECTPNGHVWNVTVTADNFKARTVDGTYFAASIELIACLDTPMTLANSSCVMSFMARSTFKLFFIDDRFLRLINHISKKNDEEY